MPEKNEKKKSYRVIIRIEVKTSDLMLQAKIVDEIDPVLDKYGAKVMEAIMLPEAIPPF